MVVLSKLQPLWMSVTSSARNMPKRQRLCRSFRFVNAPHPRHTFDATRAHRKVNDSIKSLRNTQKTKLKVRSSPLLITAIMSDHPIAGGSLGWMSRGSMVVGPSSQGVLERNAYYSVFIQGPFQDAAFALQPSATDKPIISPLVKTNFGYHIIMVEGRRWTYSFPYVYISICPNV